MPQWLGGLFDRTNLFIPHGHCYLWLPGLLWLHVISDALIGAAYVGISLILYLLVRKIKLPFSPVFIAFGLFIGLCGLTHFMNIWTVWNPDYWLAGLVKAATAAASVATAIGLFYIRPQVEEMVHAARISEERRVQLETTHAELQSLYKKVKEADELKTEFFANVSHELRTPLSLILGPAESLLQDETLTDDQRRQLANISRNGKSLLKQVNDLLDAAKLEEGKMHVHYVRVDVAARFQRITSQFDIAAERRDIAYRVSAPDSLTAETDQSLLERILINLLSNAFKFTPEHGNVEVELGTDNANFFIKVQDSGPGIKPEQRAVVFERFRQVQGGAARSHGGTGLGLAIVKDLVELQGGSIRLDDAASGGARFVVSLPLKAPPDAAVSEAVVLQEPALQLAMEAALNELKSDIHAFSAGHASAHSADRPTVLVVEDTRDVAEYIASTLQNEFNLETAKDGEDGLAKAQALQPDLIITDIMMPRMSGDQLVAALREQPSFANVPILLLTAKADDELRVKLLSHGAQDYLTKPFLPQELVARVRNLCVIKRAGDALRQELASASNDVEHLAREITVKNRQLQVALDAADVARERAEQASQVKSLFLAMISHEMRTPLAIIRLNVQMLDRRKETEALAPYRTQLDRVTRAAHQLTVLIEGLLQYTRVESGRINVQLEQVDTLKLAEEVVEAGQNEITSPDVTLHLEAPAETLAPFETDERLLRVVLSNLVSNALKFTEKGIVTIRLEQTDNERVFEVQDTGIGIAEEDVPRMFLPFERLEPIHRKSIPGVGLGLSLIKEIAEALEGRIEVASEPDQGSRFRVFLPNKPPRLLSETLSDKRSSNQ